MVTVQKLKMIHLVFLDQVLDFRVIIEIHNTIIALISYFIIAGVNIFSSWQHAGFDIDFWREL